MRLHADRELCVGSGMCVLRMPEVFDQDENDGVVVILNAEPGTGLERGVLEAVANCPAAALRVDSSERDP